MNTSITWPRMPGRLDERVLGVVQVLEQVAEEERLALLAEPEHRVELGRAACVGIIVRRNST